MKLTPLDPWILQKIKVSPPILTRQDLEAWQLQNFNNTLELARIYSRFYRSALAGTPQRIDDLDGLSRFPFTTPEDIRQNPFAFVCVSQDEIQRVVTLQSSGTTGEPKRIFFTAADQELTIDFFGVGMSTLTQPGDRVLILLPGDTPGSIGDLLFSGLARLDRIPISHGPVHNAYHTLEIMQHEKIDCLVGSPTQVLGLARRCNPEQKAPRTVLLSTDYVPAAIVRVLQNIWGCEVFNHYGTTEMGLGGGVECEAHRGYHVRESDLLFEIVDPFTGKVMPDGEYGEVVFTTLTRTGMPLIRYRTGDRSRFLADACPCGTALRTLEVVRGRFSEFIPVGDGVLKLADFDEALFPIPDLVDFSVTLVGEGMETVLMVETQMLTPQDVSPSVKKALESIPGVKNFEWDIQCQYGADRVGGLRKRTISDKRGHHA